MVSATVLYDDLDRSTGAITRHYSIGKIDYEIDLTEANWVELLRAIEPWRTYSRVSKTRETRVNQAPIVSAADRKKIRAWGRANGRITSNSGRFPNDLVRDYYATMAKNPIDIVVG